MTRLILISGLLLLLKGTVESEVSIKGDSIFQQHVLGYIAESKQKSEILRKLLSILESADSMVTIHPVTDDKSTWQRKGRKSRSHTKPLDKLKRGACRTKPTDCIIFINPDRVNPSHKSYSNGTLIHELVHACDLLYGHYHGDYKIRERRAVFFENMWRAIQGKKLRFSYHKRFATIDFQEYQKKGLNKTDICQWFKRQGILNDFVKIDYLVFPFSVGDSLQKQIRNEK